MRRRNHTGASNPRWAGLLAALAVGCGGSDDTATTTDGSTGADTSTTGEGSTGPGPDDTGGGSGSGGSSGGSADTGAPADSSGTGGPPAELNCETLDAFVEAFKASHDGNGGKDWDINAMTPDEVAADPEAQMLLALCGPDERPIIPELAWEYGGGDHPWISPETSFPFVCVYTPVNPGTEHWSYDDVADHVTADVYLGCPDDNPCADQAGADQVMACLGDMSNIEILVDTASLGDGIDAGYDLSEASTDLYLLLDTGERVHMYTGL